MLIDVSHFQGAINWAQTDPAIDGAYIKITEGSSSVDAQWSANHSGTTLHGKPAGAYHFADLGNPVTEANHFANIYLQASWQLHPVLDIETNGATANWIVQFRNQFRARTGKQGFRVYSSLSLLEGALNPANWIDANTTIWAARYNSTLGWNHPQLVLWQNTSSATVPGVVGHVDDDQFMNGWTPAVDQQGSQGAVNDMLLSDEITNPQTGKPLDSVNNTLGWIDIYAGQATTKLDQVLAQLAAIQGALSTDETAILAAINAIPAGANPTDAQVQAQTQTLISALPPAVVTALKAVFDKS